MRTCQTCQQCLPDVAFRPSTLEGHEGKMVCRECLNRAYKAYSQNPEVHLRRLLKRRSPEEREKARQLRKAWYIRTRDRRARGKTDPFRDEARRLLKDAVRRGGLAKPDHCEGCGQQFPKTKIHGHHDDYSKPLQVRWLCASCHGIAHRAPLPGTLRSQELDRAS